MRLAGGAGSSAFLLLTMHHVVVFLMGILTCVSADVAVFKLSSTLFLGGKWTLFLSFWGCELWMRPSMSARIRARDWTVFSSSTCGYFASRCIEFVALGQIIACGLDRSTARGCFPTAAVLSVVAAGIQLQAGLVIPSRQGGSNNVEMAGNLDPIDGESSLCCFSLAPTTGSDTHGTIDPGSIPRSLDCSSAISRRRRPREIASDMS